MAKINPETAIAEITVKKFNNFCNGNEIPDSGRIPNSLSITMKLPEKEMIPKKIDESINIDFAEKRTSFSKVAIWIKAIYEVMVAEAPPIPLKKASN